MDEHAIGPNPARPDKRSWKKDEQLFTRHLAKIASKRLSQFNRQALRTLFKSVSKNSGPVEANHLIRYECPGSPRKLQAQDAQGFQGMGILFSAAF